MNNLFRITKDNVSNIFVEYNKNKGTEQNKGIQKTEKKIKKHVDALNYIEQKINQNIKVSNDNYSKSKNEDELILEYGKSGIKPDILKKSMSKNLNILNHIDNIIKIFLDCNPKLKLNTLINDTTDSKNIKKIYHNDLEQIVIEDEKFFNIILKKKKYNLVNFGYIKIYDVSFTDDFVNKHKIPSLNSIIEFSNNIKHFLKIVRLLDHTDKYKIKINQLNNVNFTDIIYQNLPTIITSISEKKNLFNSTDKKFTFYLKITIKKTMAFIINKQEKLLYFFNSIETQTSGYIFFYVLNIDDKYKIINLEK